MWLSLVKENKFKRFNGASRAASMQSKKEIRDRLFVPRGEIPRVATNRTVQRSNRARRLCKTSDKEKWNTSCTISY